MGTGRRGRGLWIVAVALAGGILPSGAVPLMAGEAIGSPGGRFVRVAHFPVFSNSDVGEATVAEIVDVSEDGGTLVYTDAELGAVGFVDITDPEAPRPGGIVRVDGEPTSVSVTGRFALVAVNTSPSFVEPSGHLAVLDVASRTVVGRLDLAGQPDSVKASPDGRYAAVAVENERDEELGDGELPQLPAGLLQIVDLAGEPASWSLRDVDLTGLAEYAAEDPEPEFVDVNERNLAVVSLQENSHLAVVDLRSGRVTSDFPAGEVTLEGVDATADGVIALTDTITVPREPDGVAWLPGDLIATANEGDLFGGSRGFTIFEADGRVQFDTGTAFEELAVAHGHYPEGRSDAKGSEPEGIAFGRYGDADYLFVGSERGSFVAVYGLAGAEPPRFEQVLPAGLGPEGVLPIPERDLLVVTAEVDDPPSGIRAVISIYQRQPGPAAYPDIISAEDEHGVPIGWGAMSGLAGDPADPGTVYAVWDSFFAQSRIFTIDVGRDPAVITRFVALSGGSGDYDPEGLAVAPDGTFWLASEGDEAGARPNLLARVGADGAVLEEVGLPDDVLACRAASTNRATLGAGFEGLTIGLDGRLYVAQQRGWDYTTPECEDLDDDAGGLNARGEPLRSRIWVYDPATAAWDSIAYELAPLPALAGWVGLSEITALPDGTFAVLERDNLTGAFSEFKSLVRVDLTGDGGQVVTAGEKTARDVLPDLRATNGWIHDKPEGFAVAADGSTYLITDNDGVDDSSGETQLPRLGDWQDLWPS
ncbi:MAG: esterase-like activity of phytase family protein [Egibacteraceae bacterium]